MPLWLYGVFGGSLLISLPIAILVTKLLAQKKSSLWGLLPALIGSLVAYTAAILTGICYGVFQGLVTLLLLEITPLTACALYALWRLRRYRRLKEAYDAARSASRPAVIASLKLRRQLKGFETRSPLSREAQHEVVILLKNGNDPKALAAFYNCREGDLVAIGEAFEAYVKALEPSDEKAEEVTVSEELRDLILRLMPTATPQSLACGNGLLWSEDSTAALIRKTTGKRPTHNAVRRFFKESGILIEKETYAFTETPEAKLWEKTQYEKIRMSALEHSATLFWLYALHAKGLPYTVITAVNPEYPTVFGVYKENSGLSDFLAKLTQLTNQRIYAVHCFKTSQFKKFTAPPESVTLFPYGERIDVPE